MKDLEIYVKTIDLIAIRDFIHKTFGVYEEENIEEMLLFKNPKFVIVVQMKVDLTPDGKFSSIFIPKNLTNFRSDAAFGKWANKKLNVDVIYSDDEINPNTWYEISKGSKKKISINDT